MSHSRYSGLLISGFGLLMFFVAIPYDTETVDYGWMRPQTLPNILSWILIISGVIIASKTDDAARSNAPQTFKAAKYLAIVTAGLFFTSLFGFIVVAPILALILMLVIGERRIGWLAFGVAGIPFLIWLVVVVFLGRLLP